MMRKGILKTLQSDHKKNSLLAKNPIPVKIHSFTAKESRIITLKISIYGISF